MSRVLIAGCGYVGCALAARLVADAHDVWGLRRRPVTLPVGVSALSADLTDPHSLESLPGGLEVVFYLASAAGREDTFYRAAYVEGLRTLLEALDKQGQRPRRVIFASSTAVYAQSAGEWVDETSPTEPTHFSGVRLLEGERVLRDGPFAATCVRFGGIYGPRRTRLIDRVRTGAAVYGDSTPQYTNRIHREDCAGVLHHLMETTPSEGLFLGVDSEPADEASVLRWLAGVLGAPPPRAERESGRRSRGNKRCRNARLLAAGYVFQYPSYREGYRAILEGLV